MRSIHLVAFLAIVGTGSVEAALPVERFATPPELTAVELSPDGRNLAIVRRNKTGGYGLFLLEIDTLKARQLINPVDKLSVGAVRWLDDDWITFSAVDEYGDYRGYGRLSIKATQIVNDSGWYDDTCSYLSAVAAPPRRDGTAWAMCAGRDGGKIRIQDLETGKLTPATRDADPAMATFVVDHQGQVRATLECVEKKDGTHCTSYYRDTDLVPYAVMARWISGLPGAIYPIGFDFDDRTLFVLANPKGGTLGVHRWDTEGRTLGEAVFAHPKFDAEGIVVSSTDRRVVGVAYDDGLPRTHWLDARRAAVERELAALFPGDSIRVEFSDDGKRATVFAWSDRNPGEWHLYLPESQELKFLGKRIPQIDPATMAKQTPISYTARDGLVIHGYLTLPPGSDGKRLPLVVNPHGGPFGVRDRWGFDPDVQFLASRGYAVLQVNFRGSSGYGEDFVRAGWGQWGLKMQDDVTDGVRWAIEQGVADRDRICIYGASYGGYAALMGLIRTPELFRCGITYSGVADLVVLYRDGTKRWSGVWGFVPADLDLRRRTWFKRMIGGDLDATGPLSLRSPVHQVDKIKAPLMVIHGGRDWVTPYRDHARVLKHEIEKRGGQVDWLYVEEERHGFRKAQNVQDLYTRLEAFLAKHLAQPAR